MAPYQQGDVLLVPTSVDLSAASLKAESRVTLAEGEHTGHSHVCFADPEVAVENEVKVELVEKDGVTYLRTSGPAVVEHQEHKMINVPAGSYEVRRVQEYDHFENEARAVRD
jgi:hypothetical protein